MSYMDVNMDIGFYHYHMIVLAIDIVQISLDEHVRLCNQGNMST